jgi:hypothetical protein
MRFRERLRDIKDRATRLAAIEDQMQSEMTLVMLQKVQHAMEAAAASAKLVEAEAGHRLNSTEARLVGIEGCLLAPSAGHASIGRR